MLIGELAALAAAFAFGVTSICYTLAGRKINAVTSIAMSLPLSWIMILVIHQITLGELFPVNAPPERWLFLGISGILAYVVTSYFTLSAYQHIGPRLTMLVVSFAPVLSALLAGIFLGQTLSSNAMIGIIVVIAGIVWVVMERGSLSSAGPQQNIRRGLAYACLGTMTQATAFVFASRGVAGDFPALSATVIRITAGIVVLWGLIALRGKVGATVRIFQGDRRMFGLLSGAALFGPVIAGSLLLLSFQFVPVGIATTLSNTTAILLIPIGYVVFGERITPQAVVGTLVTIAGIAILFS